MNKSNKKTSVNRQRKQRGQNLGMHGYSTHTGTLTHPPTGECVQRAFHPEYHSKG